MQRLQIKTQPANGTTQPAVGTTQPAGQGNQADPNNAVHNLEIKLHQQTKQVKEITKQHLIMQRLQIKHSQQMHNHKIQMLIIQVKAEY